MNLLGGFSPVGRNDSEKGAFNPHPAEGDQPEEPAPVEARVSQEGEPALAKGRVFVRKGKGQEKESQG
jgi:hypothetical protein